MKKFEINENLAQAILNYLAGQPYGEVFTLIKGLQGIKDIVEEKTDLEVKEPKKGDVKETEEEKIK